MDERNFTYPKWKTISMVRNYGKRRQTRATSCTKCSYNNPGSLPEMSTATFLFCP